MVALDEMRDAPELVLMMTSPEGIDVLDDLVASLPDGLLAQTSNPNYLADTAAGVDKAAALLRLCGDRGAESTRLLSMGDGLNDLTMLQAGAVAVAPANAQPRCARRRTWSSPRTTTEAAEVIEALTATPLSD